MIHAKPKGSHLDATARKYITDVTAEIGKSWNPKLGYGWSSVDKAQETLQELLGKSDYASELTQLALTQWGINGTKIQDSQFAFIGTWASMLDYYFDAFFELPGTANLKQDMDRQVLWSQQDVAIGGATWSTNTINSAYKASNSSAHLLQLLRTAYHANKDQFRQEAWTSLMNIAGPGETTIYADVRGQLSAPLDLRTLASTEVVQLQRQLECIDSYTSFLNMAWLEDLFTRQQVPILMYNKLNVDELAAVRMAVRHRDTLVNVKYEQMGKALKGDFTPKATLLYLFKELLEVFYDKLYQVHRRKFVNDKSRGFFKVNSNEGTISRLKKVKTSFDCIKISGLLKVSPPSAEHVGPKPPMPVALTGTGKEFFYLLAKGATPFICGEYLILSPTPVPGTLAEKLARIELRLKNNLKKYYRPMKEELKYADLVKGDKNPMPFEGVDPLKIEAQLFSVASMAPPSYEDLFGK
ncbi:hypothetical protein [Corallococcus exercitus]|uniref:hypothetical protein n=1 Tax=Corallococcus exercitus TaxID=2316736 RepID=UPI0035D509CF